jgi:hypothetical protein
MDACTYESITGLKNYYGFKSLLKNGQWTQRYGCDDDTIVFNRIESYTWVSGSFALNANQVGVVLNLTCTYHQVSGSNWSVEGIESRDVDNQLIFLFGNQDVRGIVVTNLITRAYTATEPHNIVLAIFDLY